MIYIYDLLLNFQDKDRLVEFFEWSREDCLEHVKRIPLFFVPSVDMDNFCHASIKVSQEFLNAIYGKMLLYKKKKRNFYGCLFCDLNRVVAVEFSNRGEVIARSCLLLDEESEVIDSTKGLEETVVSYKVLDKDRSCSFLTREEEFCQRYLDREITSLVENKDLDMFHYLYEEIFGVDQLDIMDKYHRLIEDLRCNFDSRYQKLFQIVRLSYSKK